MTREPAIIIGVIVAIVTVIVQGGLFPNLALENQVLILTAVQALASLVQAVVTRMFVTPVSDPRDASGRSLKA